MALSIGSLVYVVFLAAMIMFNMAGNSLVCLVICKKKTMKTSVNWLLFHLAIADLLVAVFFIPPCILSYFIEQPSGIIGDLMCKFIAGGVLGWAAASASSFLLVAVAFERYFATLHPLQTLSRSRSSWLVPILWIMAIVLDIPSLVVSAYDAESQMCVENFPDYTTTRAYYLIWSFANSVVPICIIGFLYTRIILCLRNRVFVPGSSAKSVSQSRDKVTKMLISVSLIFITCWTPPAVLCVLSPVIPGGYATVYPVSTASALLNSCLNPLVYTLHSQQFRKNLVSLTSCIANKQIDTRKTKETNASGIISIN
ncbi:QRFP-like peptide receptor [Oculina patagonica]